MRGAPAARARALAPAKVNLRLELLGRRPDGYHELATWMLAVDLYDELAARPSERDGVRLTLAGEAATPDVPADERNLAVRAARAALGRAAELGLAGAARGLELELEKRIPSRAGLGGASADAAAALLASARVLGLDVEDGFAAWARATLAGLGSDTVFFLEATRGLAACRGRGERVQPLEPGAFAPLVALVTPALACPTAAIYAAVRTPLSSAPQEFTLSALLRGSVAEARRQLWNHLEEVALRTLPGLRAFRRILDQADAGHFRLSGSGSSFFGLFECESEARARLAEVSARARAAGTPLRAALLCRPAGRGAHLLAPA